MQSLRTRVLLALAFAAALPGLAWAHEEMSGDQNTGLLGLQETGLLVTSSGEELVIGLGDFQISLTGPAARPAALKIEAEADEGAVQLEIELEAPEPVAPPQEDPALAQADDEDEPDEIHFQGVLESIQGSVWVIGGRSFVVNAATELDQGLVPGVLARLEAVLGADGVSFIATEIETDADDEDEPDEIHFQGVLESIQGSVWVIGGRSFVVNGATELDQGLVPGVLARVEAVLGADGVTFIATEIETDADDEAVEDEAEDEEAEDEEAEDEADDEADDDDSAEDDAEDEADDADEEDDEDNSGPGSHSSGPGGGHHDDEDDDESDEDD